jgi:UDP-glucose 4-epimerase
MILITGGLGFIGSHTVQALLDAGEECVLVQRRPAGPPAGRFTAPVAVEQADVTDLSALLDVGKRHQITGIVHLAGSMPWPPGTEPPVGAARRAIGGLLNIMQAAQDWGVRRVGVASTLGVYDRAGVEGPLTEDMPVSLSSRHLIPAFKKIGELLSDHLAGATGIDIVTFRISATWGPLGHDDPFFPAPELIQAAATSPASTKTPATSPPGTPGARPPTTSPGCALATNAERPGGQPRRTASGSIAADPGAAR